LLYRNGLGAHGRRQYNLIDADTRGLVYGDGNNIRCGPDLSDVAEFLADYA
jgi:hypothetical protein